ncbi:nicotinamide N-methyltransferase-like isoform X2 [Mizuhopecten yessoensis]|nr:nicotinamide N-methyltransferase-like isoform X2 [Mizuhopecten yessoensis]
MEDYYAHGSWLYMEGEDLPFAMRQLHHFFSSHNIGGTRLLDVGTGPTVHSIISAAPHVENIDLSDYAEKNRKYLQAWWKNGQDYTPEFIKFVVDLEKSGQTPDERQSEMRSKVKNIFPIDVTKQSLLGTPPSQTYDIIIASLCFEAASRNLTDYENCVKNVSSVLRNGGHLIVCGELDATFYKVGDFRFPSVTISKEQAKKIYNEQGFDIVEFNDLVPPHPGEDPSSDFHSMFMMLAKKR